MAAMRLYFGAAGLGMVGREMRAVARQDPAQLLFQPGLEPGRHTTML